MIISLDLNTMRLSYKFLKKRLPITSWLPYYTLSTFLQDLLAGLTVGVTEIPQGIAYATIAGLPPEYGLYSGLLDGFVYAVFGGCKDLNIGPSSLLSLMVQPIVAAAGPPAVVLLTFLSGAIILVLGILNLGFIINFFSQPVTAGFICGGCIAIGMGQIIAILGISGRTDTFLNCWTTLIEHAHEARLWDLILGGTSLVFLILLRSLGGLGGLKSDPHVSKRRNFFRKVLFIVSIARSALTLIIGTSLSYYFREAPPFRIIGNIAAGFPTLQPPDFSNFQDSLKVFGISLAFIPLISILEALTISKIFDKAQKLDGTQEMLALGLCNFMGAFVGSMPVTGSFSRSSVNHASGVRTTLAGVFTSLILLLAIAFLTPSFYYVPRATLAAILLGALIFLFDYRTPLLMWRTKKLDFIPFFTSFFVGIFVGFDYGILLGALINVTFILYGAARPKLNILEEKDELGNDIFRITPNDTLYFPAAEFLRDTVLQRKGQNVTVIINGRNIRSMDITVAKTLVTLIQELKLGNYTVFLLDFKPSIVKICLHVDSSLEHYFYSEEAYNIAKTP